MQILVRFTQLLGEMVVVKSTLAKAMSGVLPVDKGKVSILGQNSHLPSNG